MVIGAACIVVGLALIIAAERITKCVLGSVAGVLKFECHMTAETPAGRSGG